MKKLLLVAAPFAFALTACDGAAEEVGEEKDDVMEAQAEVIDERSDVLEAQADLAEDAGNPGQAAELEAEAEVLEDTADGM